MEGGLQIVIKDAFVIEDVPKYIKLGNYKESSIGSDQFFGVIHCISTIKIVFFIFRCNSEENANIIREGQQIC